MTGFWALEDMAWCASSMFASLCSFFLVVLYFTRLFYVTNLCLFSPLLAGCALLHQAVLVLTTSFRLCSASTISACSHYFFQVLLYFINLCLFSQLVTGCAFLHQAVLVLTHSYCSCFTKEW